MRSSFGSAPLRKVSTACLSDSMTCITEAVAAGGIDEGEGFGAARDGHIDGRLQYCFGVRVAKSFPIPLRNNIFKTYLFVLGQCYHKSAACGVGWGDGERAAQQLSRAAPLILQ